MSSIVVEKYKSTNARNPRRGYWKPFIIIARIPDHRNGHYVRPNKVPLKYFDFKKDVNPYVHVRVFNFVMKANVKTFEEYITNAFRVKARKKELVMPRLKSFLRTAFSMW